MNELNAYYDSERVVGGVLHVLSSKNGLSRHSLPGWSDEFLIQTLTPLYFELKKDPYQRSRLF